MHYNKIVFRQIMIALSNKALLKASSSYFL